jgi:hypothetical protein
MWPEQGVMGWSGGVKVFVVVVFIGDRPKLNVNQG